MKKQSSFSAGGRKLSLNKKTISNLNVAEMNKHVGGGTTYSWSCHGCNSCSCHCGGGNTKNCTQNQNTCPGNNTCYAC